MKKINYHVCTVMLLGILIASVAGCEKKQGPMERAGEKIDKAVEKTGDSIEKTGEKLKDSAR